MKTHKREDPGGSLGKITLFNTTKTAGKIIKIREIQTEDGKDSKKNIYTEWARILRSRRDRWLG